MPRCTTEFRVWSLPISTSMYLSIPLYNRAIPEVKVPKKSEYPSTTTSRTLQMELEETPSRPQHAASWDHLILRPVGEVHGHSRQSTKCRGVVLGHAAAAASSSAAIKPQQYQGEKAAKGRKRHPESRGPSSKSHLRRSSLVPSQPPHWKPYPPCGITSNCVQ